MRTCGTSWVTLLMSCDSCLSLYGPWEKGFRQYAVGDFTSWQGLVWDASVGVQRMDETEAQPKIAGMKQRFSNWLVSKHYPVYTQYRI